MVVNIVDNFVMCFSGGLGYQQILTFYSSLTCCFCFVYLVINMRVLRK